MTKPDVPNTDWGYDLETFKHVFMAEFTHIASGHRYVFEVSRRRNDSVAFIQFIHQLRDSGARGFGFNNEGFDYLIIHHLYERFQETGGFTSLDAYDKAQEIIQPKVHAVAHYLVKHCGYDLWSAHDAAQYLTKIDKKLVPGALSQAGHGSHGAQIYTLIDTFTENRFGLMIWPDKRLFTQGDLYKIHHFDNKSRRTSLKKIEINRRSRTVIDLPYSPHEPLTDQQIDELLAYMGHDVAETVEFYMLSLKEIATRDELAKKYPGLGDVLNFNDTKIGKKFFEQELEAASPGVCYTRDGGRRKPRQTHRPTIRIADVISPRVQLHHPNMRYTLEFLRGQILTPDDVGTEEGSDSAQTKGFFSKFDTVLWPDGSITTTEALSAEQKKEVADRGGKRLASSSGKGKVSSVMDGFVFDFGTGGIHGSLHATSVHEDDEWEIWDWDVASYYPNLAISNRYYPAHLSEKFCEIYEQVYEMRSQYPKKTHPTENGLFKLALNGVYGDSNNKFSPFYDPQYTMSITINGQLMLCMLSEWLTQSYMQDGRVVPNGCVQMIQANTDGITVKVRKTHVEWMNSICKLWENHTGLTLESVRYSAMHLRDVNSYMAVKHADGSVKRIGAYAYETPLENPGTRELLWHKDHSMRVVAKAAEARLVHGTPIADFILAHRDPFDFMKMLKVPKSMRVEERYPDGREQRVQNTGRYYVSTAGASLTKIMPPLKKNPGVERHSGIESGWLCKSCNDASEFNWHDLNWLYYIREAEKLTSWVN